MIEILSESNNEISLFKASKTLTAVEYKSVFKLEINQPIQTHGKMNLVLYLSVIFSGLAIKGQSGNNANRLCRILVCLLRALSLRNDSLSATLRAKRPASCRSFFCEVPKPIGYAIARATEQ